MDLSKNAKTVLADRYLLRDKSGKIVETPLQLCRRVARAIARADAMHRRDPKKAEKRFFEMISKLEFVPNSPTLMNAGTRLGQLSACFVLPVEDSLESIFTTLKHMAIIHQSGGGTGFDFSALRPEGDIVLSTKGVASGPVSFMSIFDKTTDVIKQGGKRRGANMGLLRNDHPDVRSFIDAKKNGGFVNFNLSVTASDRFMSAVQRGTKVSMVHPRTGKRKEADARKLFDGIVASAWETGDPGLVFIDRINRTNPTAGVGKITATNPCGEQPLHPYESCNLGSINLARMVENGLVDYDKLRETVHDAVHFLDNVIDVNKYPIEECERMTKANRRIGLGVMGWAELLISLAIPYDSAEAVKLAEKLMRFINEAAREKSEELAKERGNFPNISKSVWRRARNATVTTIAPTGTISIIAGVTSGIEPIFAVSYVRNVMDTQLLEANPLFERIARERGFYSRELMLRVSRTGSVQGINEVPKDVQRLFRTALEIRPEWHVRMQAAFQKHCENAVSKTVNLPERATKKDVARIYKLAYDLKCKGITIFRYGSKEQQVLARRDQLEVHEEYAGGSLCQECTH